MASVSVPLPPSIDLAAWQAQPSDPGVMIADGHNVKIVTRSGQLQVNDGPPGQPRTRSIARVPRTTERLLILAGHGYITLESQRWLAWSGIPWAMLDTEGGSGEIIATSGPQREDSRLIRSQALAPGETTGLDITRTLLAAKLTGQAEICRDILRVPDAARSIAYFRILYPRMTTPCFSRSNSTIRVPRRNFGPDITDRYPALARIR